MEDFSAHTHEVPHICLPDAIPGCSSSVWNWTSLLAASRNSDRPGTCDPENTNFLFFLLGATWHVTFLHYGRVRPQILFPSLQQSLGSSGTQVDVGSWYSQIHTCRYLRQVGISSELHSIKTQPTKPTSAKCPPAYQFKEEKQNRDPCTETRPWA